MARIDEDSTYTITMPRNGKNMLSKLRTLKRVQSPAEEKNNTKPNHLIYYLMAINFEKDRNLIM